MGCSAGVLREPRGTSVPGRGQPARRGTDSAIDVAENGAAAQRLTELGARALADAVDQGHSRVNTSLQVGLPSMFPNR